MRKNKREKRMVEVRGRPFHLLNALKVVAIVVVAVALISILLDLLDSQKFIITHTTCENITRDAKLTCSDGGVCNVEIYGIGAEQGAYEIDNISSCLNGSCKAHSQKCETKEVNEIDIRIYNATSYEYCHEIGYESLGIPSEKGDKFGCIKFISKKDLTEDWLNVNCDVCCNSLCIDISNIDNISKIDWSGCEKYKSWKCGKYEVKRV